MPGGSQSRKREAAIAALLSEPTIELAARKARVSCRTLKYWLAEPDFAAAYQAARRRLLDDALRQLQAAAGDAVATLRRNLESGKPPVEVRAAGVLLDQVLKLAGSVDLEQKLAELELRISHAESSRTAGPR